MSPMNRLSMLLAELHIRPSLARVMILDYLQSERNHPTAEQIYQALHNSEKSISRATVYNTLALFEKNGLLHVLSVGENEHRYDASTDAHGHFLCEQCGSVRDFSLSPEAYQTDLPQSYIVRRMGIYCTGRCDRCAQKQAMQAKTAFK